MKFIVWRLAQVVPALLGLSVLMFVITRVMPGDPVRLALGVDATPSQIEALRERMGLDRPIWEQYADYMVGLIQGDWGESLRTRRNVFDDLMAGLPATLELITAAILIAIAVGVPLGVLSASQKDKPLDLFGRLLSVAGVGLPRFWLAIMLQLIFASVLGWVPVAGRGLVPPETITGARILDSVLTLNGAALGASLQAIALPAIALSLPSLAQIMRLTRANMIDESHTDYALAARAYGIPRTIVNFKLLLRNAFTATLTVIGLSFGVLLGTAFLVEIIFGWNGIADYGVRAFVFKDFNGMMGVTLLTGIVFAAITLLIDVFTGVLDPRARQGRGRNV